MANSDLSMLDDEFDLDIQLTEETGSDDEQLHGQPKRDSWGTCNTWCGQSDCTCYSYCGTCVATYCTCPNHPC